MYTGTIRARILFRPLVSLLVAVLASAPLAVHAAGSARATWSTFFGGSGDDWIDLKIERTRNCLLAALRILGDPDVALRFEHAFKSMERLWEAVSPDPCLYPHRGQYARPSNSGSRTNALFMESTSHSATMNV